jgi:uncharacterized protein (DUF885 family)
MAREPGPACDDPITAAVVVQQAEALVTRIDARLVEHTMVDYDTSPIGRLLSALALVRPRGDTRERNFLTRLAGVPQYLAKAADRHRAGLRAGRAPVATRTRAAIARLDRYLANPQRDPLLTATLSPRHAGERDQLLATAVRPAFARYRDVLAAEIMPHGRDDRRAGLCWLPDGDATYAALARMHTTTGRTPEDWHRIGLDLTESLAEEYLAIGSRLFGARTVAAVQHRMRTDPALRWKDGDELLTEARATVERAELSAGGWFLRPPSHRCAVEPAPEPDGPGAYYVPAAFDGSRPGTYFANAHRAHERARYLAEVTAFHEALPGHHQQLSLAQQLSELPALRRFAWIGAYIEGWGVYAERLADEMGLYSDDIARLGMLAMDSMRVARLVVDTGLHALGWSRERVIRYLHEHTVMTPAEIDAETDRYIELPGQALSYMVGRLEIQRMRARAQRELAGRFDVRAFHDAVLGSGALPLAVLDGVVAAWTAGYRAT